MRIHLARRGALVAALLVSFALTGCAMDEELDLEDDELALSEIEAEDELLAESEHGLTAAAAPSLTLTGLARCSGHVLNYSGQAITSAPLTLTFKISGGNLSIAHNGGFYSFNPGGSGTLVAKACNGSACTTRSKTIQWRSCFPGGGGGNPL